MSNLLEDLKSYLLTFTLGKGDRDEEESVEEYNSREASLMCDPSDPSYSYSIYLADKDFNRDVIKPEDNDRNLPEGAVGIRVDDDFWIMAILPYKYVDLSLTDLVEAIWKLEPGTYETKPDSGTPEQDAYYKLLATAE